MKKMFALLLSIFLIYFSIQFVFNIFSNGHDINYEIKVNDEIIKIHEILSLNIGEKNNYLIEVNYNGRLIPFKIYDTYMRKEKIVKNINIFKDNNYTCVYLTLLGNKNPNDIKCEKDNMVFLYSSIVGTNPTLDNLINESSYDLSLYKNNELGVFDKDRKMNVYPNNLPDKQTLLLEDYKGVYLVGSEVTSNARFVSLFDSDVYSKDLKYLVDKYYIVANYNQHHEFNEFYMINLSNGVVSKIKSPYYISYNSYIQGSVKEELYLIDKDSKIQYAINVKRKTVDIVGNQNNGALSYENGEWNNININELISNMTTFEKNLNTYNNIQYAKVMFQGNDRNGTYYLVEDVGGRYNVYSIYTNTSIRNFLFTTTSKDSIFIKDDYVYYVYEDNLMVFSPTFGNRKILTNNELRYNNNLKFMIY